MEQGQPAATFSNKRSAGLSHFLNSFWQPCCFAHVGRRFTFRDREEGFFVKIAAGGIYGYRAPHEKWAPLNYRGISPTLMEFYDLDP